ncbi:hypothetical protein [Pseudomonas ovata]|uniref:hypothetical protein n=1 Tax=Pseudomonas ovata TaxID=1839709 RepID=UPI0012602686|nr:hypothetical protein [Pseudomonas ovata]
MIITNRNTLPALGLSQVTRPPVASPSGTEKNVPAPQESLSATALQMSKASTRAAVRDTALSLDERAALLEQLTGDRYQANKARHDAEQPATQDIGLLARARQATDFSNGLDSNPFKAMPVDQLTLIAFDANNTFTVNERRAAWQALQIANTPHRTSLLTDDMNQAGHDLLVSRLYDAHEGPVRDKADGYLLENISHPDVDFLTLLDRRLISHVYAYAQVQGADLRYVDDLARDIAVYRRHDNGSVLRNMNDGHRYDGEGRQLSVTFTAAHATTAQRVLGGTAINSTLLDKGFVRFALDPGFRPYSYSGDPGFLEAMVMKFSADTGEDYALDTRFKTYTRDPKVTDKIVHACETIRLQPREEPVLINRQGVWTITATGKAAGYVMNPVTGIPEQIEKTPENTTEPKASSNPFEGLIGGKPARPRLLTLFDYLFMKMKTQGRVRRP